MSDDEHGPRDTHGQPLKCVRVWVAVPSEKYGGHYTSECKNIHEAGGGMEGERYRCDVCGYSYFLDYEDMK